MTRGTLYARVVLDDPDHVHCGSHDPIKGHVFVRFNPRDSHYRDIIRGPIRVAVVLRGRLEVNLVQNSDNSRYAAAGGELFSSEHILAEGNVRLTATEMRLFPFEIYFPQSPTTPGAQQVIWNHSHSVFNTESADPLPPSMRLVMDTSSSQTGMGQPRGTTHAHTRGKAYVRYEVAAGIQVPEEMEVQVNDQNKPDSSPAMSSSLGTAVLYERPPIASLVNSPVQSAPAWVMFKDADLPLLDGTLGQRKKRESMREKLTTSSKPLYVYDCHVSCPSEVYRFQPLVLQVKMLPSDTKSTTPDVANVKLELTKVKVQVTGHVKAQSAGHTPFPAIMTSQHVLSEQTIHVSGETLAQTPDGKAESGEVTTHSSTSASSSTSAGPSTQAPSPGAIMNAANDWMQTVEVDSVLDQVPSSVMTSYLRQDYFFTITCHVRLGGRRDESFETKLKVKVHPPLISASDIVEAVAGTSVSVLASEPAAPPSYEQIHGSSDVEVGQLAMTEALPPYEP